MSSKTPGPRKKIIDKTREDLLKELSMIRDREVELLGRISDMGLDDRAVRALRDEVDSLRAELRNKDDDLQVQKEELRVQTEELEAQLEELRSTSEELEKANSELKVQILERGQAVDARQQSEKKYRELVENANSIIIRWDMDGNITFFNEFAERFFGYAPGEILGKNVMGTIVPPTETSGRDLAAMVEDIKLHPERYQNNVNENIRKNGERVWVSWTNRGIRDEAGRMTGVLAVGNDITAQKRAETLLRKRADLIDLSPDGIFVRKLDGTIRFWSKGAESLYGWTRAEAKGRQTHSLLKTRFPEPLEEINRRLIQTGYWTGELAHTAKDGREVLVQSRWRAQYDESGAIKEIMESNVDITERKQAEEAAREADVRFRSLIQNSSDIIRILDKDGRIIYDSPSTEKILGYSSEVTLGKLPIEFIHPDDVERVKGELDGVYGRINQGTPTEFRIRRADGTYLDVESTGENMIGVPGVDGIVITTRPITERKRAEVVLRESDARRMVAEAVEAERRRLFDVLETLPAMICLLTPDYHVAFANRSFREKFGESGGRHCYEYCFGRSEPCDFCESYEVLKTGKPHHWEVEGEDGSVIEAHDYPFTDADGSPLILEMDIDITDKKRALEALKDLNETLEQRVAERTTELQVKQEELECQAEEMEVHAEELRINNEEMERQIIVRKQAEQALRENEQRLNRSQEIAHLGSWELDIVKNELSWSDEVYRIFGLQPQEFGATYEAFLDAIHPADRAAVDAAYSGSVREGRDTYEIEHRIVRRSTGEVRIVHEKCDHFRDTSGKIIRSVGMVHDITERKRAEEALRAKEARLAADLDAVIRLQKVGMRFIQEGDLGVLLDDIMEAAVSVAGTDKGTLQLLKPGSEYLEIVADRGFDKSYVDFFSSVSHSSAAVCGQAMDKCDRVIVEDVTKSPIFVGTPALEVQLAAGVRAVQSTPLINRRGQVIGILTTHWSEPHKPDENVLRYIDLLARQAADIIERKWAEEALRETSDYLENLINYANAPIIVWSPDFKITRFNSAFERLTGYTAGEVLDKKLDILFPPESKKDSLARIKRTLTGEYMESVEVPILRKDGTTRIALWNSANIRGEDGKTPVATIAQGQDITERKRDEEERQITVEFLRIVNESRDLDTLIKDATGFFQRLSGCEAVGIRIRDGSDYPYYETRGFPAEFVKAENHLCVRDVKGNPACDDAGYPILECMCGNVIRGRFDPSKPFFTARGSFWTNNTTQLLATTTEADRQARTRNRCNGEGYESVTVIAIRLGDECLGTLQLNDKRIGRFTPASIALWERLSDYMAIALAKFRAENELKEAKMQAELYLDLMGHDISNMHQIIMGQLELAKEVLDTDSKLGAADRELIDTSLDTLGRSTRLIENVRNLQRLRRGEFSEEVIDLADTIAGVIREYDGLITDGSISFSGVGHHFVKANKLLHDVFGNLIGNAVKHSNGTKVDIRVLLEDIEDNGKTYHQVAIEDNGPGIPEDMKDKVFNRLQRGDTKARGMGLGLYLVKSLVESYSGRVWVEDRVPGDHTKGSKFVVMLPAIDG